MKRGTLIILMVACGLAVAAEPTAPVGPVQPAMSRAEIEAGLKSHDRALYIKEGWIRDPYIILGPDDFFYLTGTTAGADDSREKTDPYNTGLGPGTVVGSEVRIWRSKDLIDWQYLGSPFSLAVVPCAAQYGTRTRMANSTGLSVRTVRVVRSLSGKSVS